MKTNRKQLLIIQIYKETRKEVDEPFQSVCVKGGWPTNLVLKRSCQNHVDSR